MEATIGLKSLFRKKSIKASDISKAAIQSTYRIKAVEAEDDMKNFLFTLGCYPGEEITLISKLADNYVINIKDARYGIDKELARAIKI